MSNFADINENEYIVEAVQDFVSDPPDSEFERGYLFALLTVWIEALNLPEDGLFVAANNILKTKLNEKC